MALFFQISAKHLACVLLKHQRNVAWRGDHPNTLDADSLEAQAEREGTMSAATAVFGTAELFEVIFSHLSMEELTRAERVSSGWQKYIVTTPTLKRTILFELQPGDIVPLVCRRKARVRKEVSDVVFERPSDPEKKCYPILRFAPPVLVRKRARPGQLPRRNRVHLGVDIRDLLLRTPGAWQQMYITQPRLTSVQIQLGAVAACGLSGEDVWDGTHRLKIEIENANGIRIANLTGTVKKMIRNYENDTGEEVSMTSYFEAIFIAKGYVWEGSKEAQKAFQRQIDGNAEVIWPDVEFEALNLTCNDTLTVNHEEALDPLKPKPNLENHNWSPSSPFA